MAPIISDMTVHFRNDRSVTQMMLEKPANIDPNKIISEDILTGKSTTYDDLREDSFKAAWALRHRLGMKTGDTVTVIGRSCVRSLSTGPACGLCSLSISRWTIFSQHMPFGQLVGLSGS